MSLASQRADEQQEKGIVSRANARVQHGAVVIEAEDAVIANLAVARTRRTMDQAGVAEARRLRRLEDGHISKAPGTVLFTPALFESKQKVTTSKSRLFATRRPENCLELK